MVLASGDREHYPRHQPVYEPAYQGTCTKDQEWDSLASRPSISSSELEAMSLVVSDSVLFPLDNGPCKQVCSLVGDSAMCSCFPGYAIMADGVSCEGEHHGGPRVGMGHTE